MGDDAGCRVMVQDNASCQGDGAGYRVQGRHISQDAGCRCRVGTSCQGDGAGCRVQVQGRRISQGAGYRVQPACAMRAGRRVAHPPQPAFLRRWPFASGGAAYLCVVFFSGNFLFFWQKICPFFCYGGLTTWFLLRFCSLPVFVISLLLACGNIYLLLIA